MIAPSTFPVHLEARLRLHTGAATRLCFAPDSSALASSGEDDYLCFWDMATREPHAILIPGVGYPSFSASGRYCAHSAFDGQTVQVQVHTLTGACVAVLDGHTDGVFGVAMFPDDTYVATGDGASVVRIWDWREQRIVSEFQAFSATNPIEAGPLYVLPDGRRLLVFGKDQRGMAHLYAIDQAQLVSKSAWRHARIARRPVLTWLRSLAPRQGCVVLAVAPNGSLIAVAPVDQPVQLYDGDTLEYSGSLTCDTWDDTAVSSLAFASDSSAIALGDDNGRIWIWNLKQRRLLGRFDAHTDGFNPDRYHSDWHLGDVAWSPTGEFIATSGASRYTWNPMAPAYSGPADYTIKLWHVDAPTS